MKGFDYRLNKPVEVKNLAGTRREFEAAQKGNTTRQETIRGKREILFTTPGKGIQMEVYVDE